LKSKEEAEQFFGILPQRAAPATKRGATCLTAGFRPTDKMQAKPAA